MDDLQKSQFLGEIIGFYPIFVCYYKFFGIDL